MSFKAGKCSDRKHISNNGTKMKRNKIKEIKRWCLKSELFGNE